MISDSAQVHPATAAGDPPGRLQPRRMAVSDALDKMLSEIGGHLRARHDATSSLPLPGCPDDETIERLIAGDPLDGRRAGIHAHLAECARCARLVALLVRADRPDEVG
jgi:hypothetical protein